MQLHSGKVVYRVNLGNGAERIQAVGGSVADGSWHRVDVTRSGLHVTLTLDGRTSQHTLSGTDFILDVTSSDVFAAGRPGVTQGFAGCLRDVQLNNYSLPTSGSNRYASVTFEGSEVTVGCPYGPCFPHPCGPGECMELDGHLFACECPNGVNQITSCDDGPHNLLLKAWAVILGTTAGAFIVVVLSLVAMCVRQKRWRQRQRRKYVFTAEDKSVGSPLFTPSQCLVVSNEPGGGEQESPIDWVDTESTIDHFLSEESASTSLDIPRAEIEEPVSESASNSLLVRANSPVIRAFIAQQVKAANEEVADIDSVRCFEEDETISPVESLSTICSNADIGHFSLAQLRSAGPKLREIAELLEGVLTDDDDCFDSTSELTNTAQQST